MTALTETKIQVFHLIPEDDTPRTQWKIKSEEIMEYGAYLKLSAAELAHTRVRFIPPGEEANYRSAAG